MTTPTPSEPLELRGLLAKARFGELSVGCDISGKLAICDGAFVVSVKKDALYNPRGDARAELLCAAVNSLPALLDRLEAQASTIEALEKGLRAIVAGDVPRPVAHHWRADKAPSKSDQCAHGVEIYTDCPNCTADFIETLLPKENNNDR